MKRGDFIVCLDFDGVIHWNISKWRGRSVIPDGVIPGTKDAIHQLRQKARVVVFSGRCASPEGRKAIQSWLDHHGIEVDEVCEHKPLADMYIDDRAIPFTGNWDEAIESIMGFTHWQRRIKDAWRRKQRRA